MNDDFPDVTDPREPDLPDGWTDPQPTRQTEF